MRLATLVAACHEDDLVINPVEPSKKQKIAVVGAGPAGLSFAKTAWRRAQSLGKFKVTLGRRAEGLGRFKVPLGRRLEGLGKFKVPLGRSVNF